MLMGNFCHGDKNKENQPEDIGNDACIMLAYHAKVNYNFLQQNIQYGIIEDPLVSGDGQTISYQHHVHANTIRSSREQHCCSHNL
jgi:hypothetical protein